MPDLDFTASLWAVIFWRLGVVVLVALLVAVLAYWVHRRTALVPAGTNPSDPPTGNRAVETFVVLFSIALIGALVGDLSGSSQESVAGQLVPAILTLIGVFSVYLFGKEHDQAGLINLAVLAFVLALSIAYSNGLIQKRDKDAFYFCRGKYSDAALLANEAAFSRFNDMFTDYCAAEIGRHTNVAKPAAGAPQPAP